MIALVGFLSLLLFVTLVATRRVHVLIALVVVPVIAALVLGDYATIGEMVADGLLTVAPTGLLILFSVLFFSTMIDTGLFDPLVNRILAFMGHDPLRITLGTVGLTLLISLDGDGTTTFILIVLSLLPVYKKAKMNPLILMTLATISFYIMNSSPWGGPTTRTMAVLDLQVSEVFTPMIPALIAGVLFVFGAAIFFGFRERRRLAWSPGYLGAETSGISTINYIGGSASRRGRQWLARMRGAASSAPDSGHTVAQDADDTETDPTLESEQSDLASTSPELKRPKLIIVNLALTVVVMACVIFEILPPHVTFILGFVIALVLNYRSEQVEGRIRAHAGNALWATALIFAAGSFTGIFTGTGMIAEMAVAIVDVIPDSFGGQLAIITGLLSFVSTLFMSPDAFYFGILPVLSETGVAYGLEAAEIGRAALFGQVGYALSPLVAAPLLLSSLVKVNYFDHQKHTIGWAFGCTLTMLAVAALIGIVPLF